MKIFKYFKTKKRLLEIMGRNEHALAGLAASVEALIERIGVQNDLLVGSTTETLQKISRVTGAMASYFDEQVRFMQERRAKQKELEDKITVTEHDLKF